MQPDIWEEWWRPACVLDMQPAMWSTRCRRACVRSHAERHTGCHQPEADWLVSPINTPRPQLISSHPDLYKPISKHERKFSIDFESAPREGSVQLKANQMKISSDGNQFNVAREKEREKESTEKASSVQSMILYDCDAEALSISIRPGQSYSVMVKWRCLPELVQFHGFRSVEVMLDTPPRSPKNCPESRGGSVRVQISLSRPVSFFMVKPRLCPRQDQSSPVKSSRPLGFGQVLSDQPAAYRQRTLFPLLGSWIMARGQCFLDLVPSGFKETPYSLDREHSERRGHVLWLSGRGVNFVTLTGSSLTRHVALPDHSVGLDGQSCSCLIVGWPVGLSSPTLGVDRPSVILQFWLDRTHSFRISPKPGTKSVKENATKQPAFANPETVFVRKQCCNVNTLAHQYAWPRSYQGKMLTLGWMMESQASISTTWTNQTDLDSPVHQNSSLCPDQYTDQSTGRASMLICVLTWCISCPKSVHGQSTGRASMLICVVSMLI
ncbi:hypothetical protein IGI04_042900 [Brassica rapa subsp. trilocularis]|uniref:Uncharacterized protein n=1 Tax=Brassica rapa subsp. trilocularis TaxID=1813537 RepID=A0ABQ7KJX9_BRACM|nr:hypothetical protein IGI04_042900 [Brassica rapa subsp. trilocularis]